MMTHSFLPHVVRKRDVDAECGLIELSLEAGGYDPTDLPIRYLAEAAVVRRLTVKARGLGIIVMDEEIRRTSNGDLEICIGLQNDRDAVVLKLAIA